MNARLFSAAISIAWAASGPLPEARAGWELGAARVDITPRESVPLAGYGGATRMSGEVIHPIWLKALALRDEEGETAVLVTADLVGLSRSMTESVSRRVMEAHGIARERLILNSSHNHSAPVTGDVLWLYYDLSPEEAAARDRYTAWLHDRYVEVAGLALADLEPGELSFGQGLAGVAVNRRRSRPGSRGLGGQVDQDVPVLAARAGDRLKAIVFGYSCHTTSLSGLSVNGDYAGYAQIAVERAFPGAVALFVQNCGGDANPLPRLARSDEAAALALSQQYGEILGEAARQAMAGEMAPLSGPFRAVMGETELMLEEGPTREELERRVPGLSGMPRRMMQHLLDEYLAGGAPADRVPYPVQVWRFGDGLTFIALTGEVVADYSLRFKESYGWDSTWVAGYNNDLLSYVPSLRVLREGGYEGVTGMHEYGHRGPYAEDVEDRVAALVDSLVRQATAGE